jgi:hypothetical protein
MDRAAFELALVSTHLPTLAVCAMQARGDYSLMDGESPTYDFFGDGMGNFSEGFAARIRSEADAARVARDRGRAPSCPAASGGYRAAAGDMVGGRRGARALHAVPA